MMKYFFTLPELEIFDVDRPDSAFDLFRLEAPQTDYGLLSASSILPQAVFSSAAYDAGGVMNATMPNIVGIFIEGKRVNFTPYDHLYLVAIDDNGNEYVIRGGPQNDSLNNLGLIITEAGVLMSASEDNRDPADSAARGSRELNFGDQSLTDVWAIMAAQVEFINDALIEYTLPPQGGVSQNSNSVVASVLNAVGVNVLNVLPDQPFNVDFYTGAANPLPGIGISNLGTVYSDQIIGLGTTDRIFSQRGDDIITPNAGNDIIDGGDGTDTVILNGAYQDFAFQSVGRSVRITDFNMGDGNEGTNDLVNVEYVRFQDGNNATLYNLTTNAVETIFVDVPFASAGNTLRPLGRGPEGHAGSSPAFDNAWDFALPSGTDLFSVGEGRVIEVRDSVPDWGRNFNGIADLNNYIADNPGSLSLGSGSLGNYITVVYNEGLANQFYMTILHLRQNSAVVSEGDPVSFGQQIAEVGHTGYSTGPHLHVQFSTALNTVSNPGSDYQFANATADQTSLVRLRDPDSGELTPTDSDDAYFGQNVTDVSFDAGNTFDTARNITDVMPFATDSGSVGFGSDTDDYLYLEIAADGVLTIELSSLSADVDLQLFDYLRQELPLGSLSENSQSRDEIIQWNVLAGEGYYIHIDPFQDAASRYNLSVEVAAIGGGGGTGSAPDLVITDFSITNTVVADGDRLLFDYNVRNIGGSDFGTNGDAGLYLSTNSRITQGDMLLRDVNFRDVAAGDFDNETPNYLIDTSVIAPGTYWIGVIGDINNEISGDDDSNNTSNAIQITIGETSVQNEFTILSFTIDTAKIPVGGEATVEYQIINSGTQSTSSAVDVGFYISTDTIFGNSDDIYLERDGAGILSSGEIETDTDTLGDLADFGPGTYYLFAVADYDFTHAEGNENNNVSDYVTLEITAPAHDISILSASLSDSTIEQGEVTTLTYTVTNTGIEATSGGVDQGFWVSTDQIFGDADDVYLERDGAGILSAGEVNQDSDTLQDIADLAPGVYYIYIRADYENEFAEGNETDNEFGPLQLTITPRIDPDFTASDLVLDDLLWEVGDTVIANWNVNNIGNEESDSIGSSVYLSADENITTDDILLATDASTGRLSVGEMNAESRFFNITSDLAPGTYFVGVISDFEDVISESNEGNNVSNFIQITVLAPALFTSGDDTVTLISAGTYDALGGEDLVYGSVGNDTIDGGGNDDTLFGGDGNDTLLGNVGNDFLDGGLGNDILYGNDGDDILDGGAGADLMLGRDGDDTIYFDADDRRLNNGQAIDLGGTGRDTLIMVDGATFVTNGLSVYGFEVFRGSTGNDSVRGNVASVSYDMDGGGGNDRLIGLSGDDILRGGAGDDFIAGASGNNILDGGDGNDTLSYETAGGRIVVRLNTQTATGSQATGDTISGFENVVTGAGNDALIGSDFANILTAGAGDDYIDGLAGDDVLNGGTGNDRLFGRDGDDTLNGGFGDDMLDGGSGNDTVVFDDAGRVVVRLNTQTVSTGDTIAGFENATTGAGNDALIGSDFANILTAGAGDDYIDGLAGDDVLNGGTGNDRLFGGDGNDTVVFDDMGRVVVRLSNQTVSTGDTIFGFENATTGAGNDALIGSNDANILLGRAGDDYIDGLDGSDTLNGGDGNDRLFGRDGDDTLNGGSGNDTLDGGDGTDTVVFDDAGRVVVRLSNQTVNTGDTIAGFENATTGEGNDALIGSNVANILSSQAGDDYLDGQGGDDVLIGGTGNDRFVGGAGEDIFIYDTITGDSDQILDFTQGEDQIQFSDQNSAFDTFSEVMTAGTQDGADAVFDFGGGNILRLANTMLGDLTVDDIVFVAAATSAKPDEVSDDIKSDLVGSYDGLHTIKGERLALEIPLNDFDEFGTEVANDFGLGLTNHAQTYRGTDGYLYLLEADNMDILEQLDMF